MKALKKLVITTFLPCIFTMMSSTPAIAGIIIADAGSGAPLPKASIFDKNGSFIGVSNDDGIIPATIKADSYPLNIRYVGYSSADIPTPDLDKILMYESPYELPEIIVNEKERNLLHVTAYVRIFSSGIDSTDTLTYFTEQIVDFMLPLDNKAKFKGWEKSRVLASRKYAHIIKNKKTGRVDSLQYEENEHSFGPQFYLAGKTTVPEALYSGKTSRIGTDGKYSQKNTWTTIGNNYFLMTDMLADYKDHVYSSNILKLLGMTSDLTKYEILYKINSDAKGQIRPDMINEVSYVYDLVMKGKALKWMSGQKEPITIHGYGEMFVIDREYLTADDAKALKKNPPEINAAKFLPPDNIPDIPAEIIKIKQAVVENHFDND